MGWAGALAPTLTALSAHALSLLAVVLQLRRRCRRAVAPTIAVVAVTLLSRCHSAVAVTLPLRSCGQPPRVRASRSPALPCRPCRSPLASWPCRRSCRSPQRCRGGWLPRIRALRRTRQPYRPPLALRPSCCCCRHRRWRRWRSPHPGGGNVIVLGVIHRQCERRLVNSRALGRLCHTRRPPPRALMGVVIGFVVTRKCHHCPRRHPSTTRPLPLLCCSCIGPPLLRARALRRRPLPRCRHWGHPPCTRTPLFCWRARHTSALRRLPRTRASRWRPLPRCLRRQCSPRRRASRR